MSLNRDDFTILGVRWQVKEIPGGDSRIDDACGKCDFSNHTIWICSDMPWEERIETLLHETCHAICAGRQRVDLTLEDDLRWFSMILLDTLTRNDVSLRGEYGTD